MGVEPPSPILAKICLESNHRTARETTSLIGSYASFRLLLAPKSSWNRLSPLVSFRGSLLPTILTSLSQYGGFYSGKWLRDCNRNKIRVRCLFSQRCIKASANNTAAIIRDEGYVKGYAKTCSASDVSICNDPDVKCDVICCLSDYCNGASGPMVQRTSSDCHCKLHVFVQILGCLGPDCVKIERSNNSVTDSFLLFYCIVS